MKRRAFTLIELVLAMAASAVLLAAIYGVFSSAVHARDEAVGRTRAARVRARAANVLRNDLRNALVSGGILAAVLEGSAQSPGGGFPGYLKFTTTTAPDAEDVPNPDVQQVEYYIVTDKSAVDQKAGMLVRAYTRNLLATTTEVATEEPLLAGVESMEVAFYDGTDWQDSWQLSSSAATGTTTAASSTSTASATTTLPQAVRVRIQPARKSANDFPPAPLEVLVPWTTAAGIDATTTSTTGGTP